MIDGLYIQGELTKELVVAGAGYIEDSVKRGIYFVQRVQTPGGPFIDLTKRACYMVPPGLCPDGIVDKMEEVAKLYAMEALGFKEGDFVASVQFTGLYNPVGPGIPAHTDFDPTAELPLKFITMAYLNDDFEGGELIFPTKNITIKPRTGLVIAFASDILHQVMPLKSGRRMSMQRGHTFIKRT